MGSSKSPQLPATPTYQQNSNLGPNIDYGSQYNTGLLSGDFTGDRSWLSSLVNPNNSANSLSYAQGLLQPQFRDTIQSLTNQAVANNQNTSSTFTDALAKAGSDLNSQYQSIVSGQAINDANQANANKLSLLGQGESGLQGFTGLAQNQTNSENSFNLQNYENQVAAAIANQKQANGGIAGALTGAAGGALAGSSLGPFGAIAGGLAGGLSGGLSPQSSNYGGNILSSGASLYGSNQQNDLLRGLLSQSQSQNSGIAAPIPGFYASNSLGNQPTGLRL